MTKNASVKPVFLLTGGTCGTSNSIAKGLAARRGITVVLTCRDEARGALVKSVSKESGNPEIQC